MKKVFFTFFVALMSQGLLFPTSDQEESKASKLIKIPLSFLPSNENDAPQRSQNNSKNENKNEQKKEKNKKSRYKKRLRNKKYKYLINSWEPYWVPAEEVEDEKHLFFQANIGVGFLYFNKVQGNLGGNPSRLFTENGSVPYKGRLRYNKTPIFEYLLGYQFKPWLSGSFSYQNQSAVTIFTKFIDGQNTGVPAGDTVTNSQGQFSSQFAIDAFMLKGFVEFPWPMIWKLAAYSPYLGAGIGVGWQSWTGNEWNLSSTLNEGAGGYQGYLNSQIFLKSKYDANVIWGLDAGLKIQSALTSNHFAVRLGCKYNQWGQARSIGKIQDQGSAKLGLFKPFKIKTVYSFAPYLAFQWNIENSSFSAPPNKINGRYTNTWKPYFADANQLQMPRAIFSQFTGGIGFLYFAGIKGDISMEPFNAYQAYGRCPGKYSMRYNRTPVIEYIFGFRLSPWVKIGFSKQFQSNIYVHTKLKPNRDGAVSVSSQFQGNLNLLAGALKVYVEVPKPLIWKNLASTFYVAGAFGPSWQSWSRMGVAVKGFGNQPFINREHASGFLFPLRSKVIPNPYFMADAGLKVKNARFDVHFYMIGGFKYSYWGASRNLGEVLQQYPSYREGLFRPLTIKQLYSLAPYLGVQWDFGSAYHHSHKKPYTIDGRETNVILPYFARVKNLYKDRPFYTQVNTGIGFLYFERVRANLAGEPSAQNFDIYGEFAYSDTPGYNRTPLFEFLIGRRVFPWFNAALSYYFQGGVAISTPVLHPTRPPAPGGQMSNTHAMFVANFRADAILAKFYFKLPWSVVWMRTITKPYAAVGIGGGWQSWTRIDVQRIGIINSLNLNTQMNQPLNQKISANVVWTVDFGFKTCSAYPNSKISSTVGMKFVDWGQARSMGKAGDLNGSKNSLFKPFRVRMVYSFAPYFGIQWNF